MIIVNYNGGLLVEKAVDSVRRQTMPCELVVVDNASTDTSVEGIAKRGDVTILRSPRNVGFGAGVNLGALGATTPFLAMLNPDAVAAASWLADTVAWMTSEEIDLGSCIIGAGAGYYFTRGTWNRWRGAAVTHNTLGDGASDWLNACALVIRRPVFERLKGFDERYFLYSEDVDLSLRARAAGARLGVLQRNLVEHEKHGYSAMSLGDRVAPIAFVSRGRLVARHVPIFGRPLACVLQAVVVPALWSKNVGVTLRLASAFARGYAGRSAKPSA